MSMFAVGSAPAENERTPIPMSDVDVALTAQLVVAWAGEDGEERRLGWWRSDLVSEFGGEDLFKRLLPSTWRWAMFQGAREAARRTDMKLRDRLDDPDQVDSLFGLGFELDERIEERFQDLKRSGRTPDEALPGLTIVSDGWHPSHFWDWVNGHGVADVVTSPVGRRLKGTPPTTLGQQVRKLVAGLAPAAEKYPLPHYRKAS
jgi:hypothetical protein